LGSKSPALGSAGIGIWLDVAPADVTDRETLVIRNRCTGCNPCQWYKPKRNAAQKIHFHRGQSFRTEMLATRPISGLYALRKQFVQGHPAASDVCFAIDFCQKK
jgi:hypothetical protein